MERGDIFDLGNGAYEEFIETTEEGRDRTIIYTRKQIPPYGEIKILSSTGKGFLQANFRKIGPREKNRLLVVYARVPILRPEQEGENGQ